MGSITTALFNSANALEVFSRAFGVIQNNIANANTPGYVKQTQLLVSQPFDLSQGLSGGVAAGPVLSARSEYLEQAVRLQQQFLGAAQQRSGDLGQIEPLFDLSSSSGVASAIDGLFASFSQLSVSPNDFVSRQAVLDAAGRLAASIRASAAAITQLSTNISSQTANVAGDIDNIASRITEINSQYQSNSQASRDAGLDAQLHSALEDLSQLTDFSVIKAGDGSVTVAIGGQTPLVIGDKRFPIAADPSSGRTAILDAQGNDITSQITQGRLGALLQEKNTTLPGYLTDLNTLAKSLADTVNGQLAAGVDRNGNTPTVPLFAYDPSDAAASMAANSLTPDQIAAASAAAPGGNGNAIALAQLANTGAAGGFTFTQFYGNLGARLGSDIAAARDDRQQAQDQLTQAQSQRADQSAVSLNEEAARLLQFQQAYQAAGKLVSVLDSLTQTVIDMVH